MVGITLEQAQAQLDSYMAAEIAVLSNQSYKIGNREFKRADLAVIQTGITTWNDRVKGLLRQQLGRSRSRTIVARG
jgi:hypothetical protein